MKRQLGFDYAKIAKDAMERYKGKKPPEADDFLTADAGAPDYDSDDYVNTTGMSDGMDMGEVEGTGDKRKSLIAKAIARSRMK